MAICETCGNNYESPIEVRIQGRAHTFDTFQCAIHALAPACEHCGARVIGHGVDWIGDRVFCCPHCAEASGLAGL